MMMMCVLNKVTDSAVWLKAAVTIAVRYLALRSQGFLFLSLSHSLSVCVCVYVMYIYIYIFLNKVTLWPCHTPSRNY